MRGRTNIVQRLGAIVNGEIITAEVSGEDISVGDFVSIKYSEQKVEMFTEPKVFQKIVKIENSNLYLWISQESGSNLVLQLYEYTDNELKILDSKITYFGGFNNFCDLENNYFLLLGYLSSNTNYNSYCVFKVDVENKVLNITENPQENKVIKHCFLMKKNNINYLIMGYFSSYYFYYKVYTYENGILTEINTSFLTINIGVSNKTGWISEYVKSVEFEKALFLTSSKSNNTSGQYLESCYLSNDLELILEKRLTIYTYLTESVISHQFVIDNKYLLLVNEEEQSIKLYDKELNVVSTFDWSKNYGSEIRGIWNYYNNRCIFCDGYEYNYYVLDFLENDLIFKLSNKIVINDNSINPSRMDSVLLNSNEELDKIFLFYSYGYKLVSYEDGIFMDGVEGLNNKVMKYNGKSIGFAKTGGKEGQTIQVYVPTKEGD